MPSRDSRIRNLSKYQHRVFRDYERILETAALNPERVLEIATNDAEAVVPVLRSMTDQVVRSEVIFEYTLIDMELDSIIFQHFFGKGKRLRAARRTRRYRTLQAMLQNLYILQKLPIVRKFKSVPKSIVSKISTINELRNGLAHTFFLEDLSPSKRTYRGLNVFTRKGFEAFRKDAWEIRCFFTPWLANFFPDDSGLCPEADPPNAQSG